MKKINLKRVLLFSIGLIGVAIIACSFFGFDLLAHVGLGGGALVMAETTVVADAPVETTDTAALNRIKVYNTIIEENISMAPLDKLVRESGRTMTAEGWEVKDFAITARSFSDTVAEAYATVGATYAAEIVVSNIDMWNPDDTCMIDCGTGSTHTATKFLIESIDTTSNEIKIRSLGASPAAVPSIDAERAVYRLAPAMTEDAAQVSPYALIPGSDTNYCQRFGIQFEESLISRLQLKEVEFGLTNIEKNRVWDYKASLDASFLFGTKAKTTNSDRKIVYTMGGFVDKIENIIEYGKSGEVAGSRSFTDDNMRAIMRETFAGNNGSKTRFMFMGSQFVDYAHQAQSVVKQLEAGNTKIVAGLEFDQYRSTFGTVMQEYHPILDQMGWSEKAVIIDLNNIIRADLIKFNLTELELKKSGIRNVKAYFGEEAFSILVTNLNTHAVIQPKA
jgi:hypothetical protein